jgi:hypothetical protein
MKKAKRKVSTKASKSAKPKAPAKKRAGGGNPILNILNDMDEDVLAMLKAAMAAEIGPGGDLFGPDDPVELFEAYLEDCADESGDEDEKNELMVDLVESLDKVRIDANGGDPDARAKIKEIYGLLKDAIANGALGPIDLMMTGKMLSDAGWEVPEILRDALGKAMEATQAHDLGDADASGLTASLLELVEQNGMNAFDVHEQLNSVFAGLPPEFGATLAPALVDEGNAVVRQAVAGFALHADPGLARSALAALAAAAREPVESLLIERLVCMRPWLPADRQGWLDAAVRAMRANALPPAGRQTPKLLKCFASVCDGSGASNLVVEQKAGAQWRVATVMIKATGVAEAMTIPELRKSDMEGIMGQLGATMPTGETDLAGLARILGLALADNLASGVAPPFKLVEIVESLGLDFVHPENTPPHEVVAALLADLPPEQTDAAAATKAHAAMAGGEFSDQWFEAGEALEQAVASVKGKERRIAKVLQSYLPARRQFWARQCARSALALRGEDSGPRAKWKQLALVGRDIASDTPLEKIPLIRRIAELSVEVFEGRM